MGDLAPLAGAGHQHQVIRLPISFASFTDADIPDDPVSLTVNVNRTGVACDGVVVGRSSRDPPTRCHFAGRRSPELAVWDAGVISCGVVVAVLLASRLAFSTSALVLVQSGPWCAGRS